jgi:hypothetical protein
MIPKSGVPVFAKDHAPKIEIDETNPAKLDGSLEETTP